MRARFRELLWPSTMAQAPFLGIALGFVAAQLVLVAIFRGMEMPAANSVLLVMISTLLMLGMVLVANLFAQMLLSDRPRDPTWQLIRRVWGFLHDIRAMSLGLPVFVSLVIFIYAFSSVKGNIPVFQPFAWDRTFDHWDMVLHLGRRPWEWLQPVVGHWPVTFVINVLYNLWFAVLFSVLLHFAFMTAPGVARTRFFLTFLLQWMIGGGLMAVLFSSAGPCFYGAGHLGLSPDPYAPLMAYLHDADRWAPIWALDVQDELWKLHAAHSAEASLSAMPSMHNGSTLLFALASGGFLPWIRRFLKAYVAVIFVGSIHLGYHYAVDSYVAWALTLAIWWAAGYMARRWEATRMATRFRAAFAESPASL